MKEIRLTIKLHQFNEVNELEKEDQTLIAAAPCGICRQVIREVEERQGKPLRILLVTAQGNGYIIPQGSALLPLGFHAGYLKKD